MTKVGDPMNIIYFSFTGNVRRFINRTS
ncbi:class Ib ribonucleoside-diphosphate reductase assembly flavoprotein NrdI, partial [Staphylococcus aureus]